METQKETMMREVKVKKTDLLKVLRKNRAAHRQIFEEALVGYQEKVVAALERSLAQARKGQRVAERFYIQQPQDQTAEYDKAIAMCEMSVDGELTLTSQEFEAYVMDRWQWKDTFLRSNSLYSKMAADAIGGADEA
ncbi:MAG TPA: hypothetical protein VFN38_07605 [Gemmatimonadaceae bacterium]|nr:hypothetical protein [Gemmatimonadaceae bacterium]